MSTETTETEVNIQVLRSGTIGSLSNYDDDDDDDDDVDTASRNNRFNDQNNSSARASHFYHISLTSTALRRRETS